VGLNPALQEESRHGNTRSIGLDAFELHAGEPAAVYSLSNFRTKTPFNACPAFIGNLGHFSSSHKNFPRPIADAMIRLNADGSAPSQGAKGRSPVEGEGKLSRI
jgi:hypothetical protein